ncbi:MAG: relaxase/mobilization nuclease domain-containing protein [Rhizobiaceae bacterium]
MILDGNQRGGAREMAIHLMKPENEHIEVHEIRGFVSDTIKGALREAEAISRGTKCRQFLYSLSLSPPEKESVPIAAFEKAIEQVEAKLGLVGHPRIVVFHEKHGRRHAHCVWSRIDAESMTAVRMSHDRFKLGDISRQLYMEHGWRMPEGLIDPALRDPLSFDRKEWFLAKRAGKDPRDIKAAFQQCWAASDSGKAFRQALEQRGYHLAHGDRRGVVAVDTNGEVYAVARWAGVRTKDVTKRFGPLDMLPSVREAQSNVSGRVRDKLTGFLASAAEDFARSANALEARRVVMVEEHRAARRHLHVLHEERHLNEARQRAERFRKGILGLWDRVTGQHARLRVENESEAATCTARDAGEKQALIDRQLQERSLLQDEIRRERRQHVREMTWLNRQISEAERGNDREAETPDAERTRRRQRIRGPSA